MILVCSTNSYAREKRFPRETITSSPQLVERGTKFDVVVPSAGLNASVGTKQGAAEPDEEDGADDQPGQAGANQHQGVGRRVQRQPGQVHNDHQCPGELTKAAQTSGEA